MAVPSKEERLKCWTARDAYFQCCDQNGLLFNGRKPKAGEELLAETYPPKKLDSKQSMCTNLKNAFSQACLPSWQDHFSTERLKERQKEQLIKDLKAKEEQIQSSSDDFWNSVRKQ